MKLLEGVRVLDVSWLIPGPHLTMMLADMGADVIKLETPQGGDYFRIGRSAEERGGLNLQFLWLNRNKRSITVDFKKAEGRDLILDMARTSHVFVEGSRPGAITKYGLGYDDLKAANPKIVYCSISGFGQDGPVAQLASHGGAFDAISGVAEPLQLKNGSYVQWRPYPHPGVTDGPWLSALGIVGGLYRAQMTGEGCYLDMACADAALQSYSQEILPSLNEGEFKRDPEAEPSAKYSYYQTKDNKFMLIASIERHLWENFCDAADRPDLKTRGDWTFNRMDQGFGDIELRDELVKIFKTKTQAEWTKLFVEKNIAGGPYYAVEDLPDTDYFQHRKMFVEQEHPRAGKYRMTANAIKVQGDPFELKRPAPELGQHTDEVLKEFGYNDERIKELRAAGAI